MSASVLAMALGARLHFQQPRHPSGLSTMQSIGLPVWAALSTAGLRALELPDHLRDVIILADGDGAGEAAGLRWRRQGGRILIARPPRGLDFNDLLLGPLPSGEVATP